MPKLEWLEGDKHATLVRKDCINGCRLDRPGRPQPGVDWVNQHKLEAVLVVGICTDICVMDFVLTFLSARNHEMMPSLRDILVYEAAARPRPAARHGRDAGLPPTAAHPRT